MENSKGRYWAQVWWLLILQGCQLPQDGFRGETQENENSFTVKTLMKPSCSPDSQRASLQCWTPQLPLCFCLRHHHWRRPIFPPRSDWLPYFVIFSPFKAAATDSGVWPEVGGPQGSLGESLKRWTNQPGIPLVSARWEKQIYGCTLISMSEKTVMQLQLQAATSPSPRSGWPSKSSRRWYSKTPHTILFIYELNQERHWDIKVIFDSGSAWLNADAGDVTIVNFPDMSKVPLVLGGIGYFRCHALLFYLIAMLLALHSGWSTS